MSSAIFPYSGSSRGMISPALSRSKMFFRCMVLPLAIPILGVSRKRHRMRAALSRRVAAREALPEQLARHGVTEDQLDRAERAGRRCSFLYGVVQVSQACCATIGSSECSSADSSLSRGECLGGLWLDV